jgi:protein-S-isoprenylcysteine O-methyltransferase Ste14
MLGPQQDYFMSDSPGPLDSKTPRVIPPPVLFLAALCLGVAVQYVKPRALLAHAAVGYAVGGAPISLGLTLSTWMVLHFRRSGTPVSPLLPSRQLVVSGPYRFSRNPDYIGQTVIYVGIALVLNSVWVFLALFPALLLVRYAVIAREERYLRSRFGAEYASYCQRVRRWF